MKCPSCGNEIENGHVICERCGFEIQIVPSFDAEIENRIDETLSGILDGIDIDNLTDEQFEVLSKTMDINATLELKNRMERVRLEKQKTREIILDKESESGTRRLFDSPVFIGRLILSVAIVIILVTVGVVLAININSRNSTEYMLKKAQELYQSGEYEKADELYMKVLVRDAKSDEAMLGDAKSLIMMRDYQGAREHLEDYIKESQIRELYEHLIEVYEVQEDYQAITLLLENCPLNIASTFNDYVSLPPTFDHDEGNYEEQLVLKIMSDAPGKIYYTLDGSEPTKESTEYKAPITIVPGKTVIRAIFVNQKGVYSESVTKVYVVTSSSILAPIISPESGDYDKGQYITAAAEDGLTIYYTDDGTAPDEYSKEYEYPLLMPRGDSVFKFIAIDSNGKKSDISSVNYNLEVAFAFDELESVNYVITSQIFAGKIIDIDGLAADGGRYYYQEAGILTSGMLSYMLFEEYYSSSGDRENAESTNTYFAVENVSAGLYVAKRGENGLFEFKAN